MLTVQSDDGSVYWETSAYGGLIALAGRTEAIKSRFAPILYRVDPVSGDHATESPLVTAPNDLCWWLPTYEKESSLLTERASMRVVQILNKGAYEAIVAECMDEHLPHGEILTIERAAAISTCVAERYVARLRNAAGVSPPNSMP